MSAASEARRSSDWLVHWLLLLTALVVSVVVARRTPPRAPQLAGVDPLAAVPVGPELLLSANLAELAAVAGPELLQAGGAQLLGLRELCGFEPLLGLRRVVLALPPRQPLQSSPDFAFIAETSLEGEAVLRCAEAVIGKRGGRPVRSQLGAFRSVRDQRKPAGEIAVRADGLLILSGGAYLRAVLDAAAGRSRGDAAARLRSETHQAIREQLGPAQLSLTLLPGALLSLPELRAAGLSLRLERDIELRGFVGCASVTSCQGAKQLLQGTIAGLVQAPELAPLGSLVVSQQQTRLEIRGRVPRQQLGPLLSRLLGP
ncbi:MAG TPA: hypothetical protein VIW29_13725 [Polyangiaceae bacterium]